MSASPSFISIPQNPAVSFANVDSTTFKTMATGAVNGTRVDFIFGANTDAANPYTVQFALQKSGQDYVIGEVVIPIGAGTNGTAKSVACLNPTDMPALTYSQSGGLYLASGVSLRARVKTSVAGGNSVQLVGVGGDY